MSKRLTKKYSQKTGFDCTCVHKEYFGLVFRKLVTKADLSKLE